jgi:hypothetical protein
VQPLPKMITNEISTTDRYELVKPSQYFWQLRVSKTFSFSARVNSRWMNKWMSTCNVSKGFYTSANLQHTHAKLTCSKQSYMILYSLLTHTRKLVLHHSLVLGRGGFSGQF